MPPDVHIFTTTKQKWVDLSQAEHVVDVFYDYEETWTQENLERRKALLTLAAQ